MLFSFSLFSFLLCTSVAATSSPRDTHEPASDSEYDENMKPPFPHLNIPLATDIRLSDSSYEPADRQPIKLLSFYGDQHSLNKISIETTTDEAKSVSVSELTKGNSPWLIGKWKRAAKDTHSSIPGHEPPTEICILWKNKKTQAFFVVKDETPALTLERGQFTLPVVKKEHPFETGVRLSIASALIPSGTTYLSFHHRDRTRRYIIFKNNLIATYIAGDKTRTYKVFPVAKLTVAANGKWLNGKWKRESRSAAPLMLEMDERNGELYVSETIQQSGNKQRKRPGGRAAAVQ
ncbi:hypothetical protein F5887DRAFT_1249955 [Amanita rubescens]|nr:hypothetical protein F5887DRAFT_1249955 [Amanita rubescens]